MNAERYDLIVLGSGSAARDGAGKAVREHGARVALIEHRLWGGSCPNVACRPTKAYVVAAELMHDVREHAAERGIDLPEPTIELGQTRKWKDSLRRDQQSWRSGLDGSRLPRGARNGSVRGCTERQRRRPAAERRQDPHRHGQPHSGSADSGHRGHRMARPHQRARARRGAGVAARRRRGPRRPRVRTDLRAVRLARDGREQRPADRRTSRRGGGGRAAGRARGRRNRDRAQQRRRLLCARRATASRRQSAAQTLEVSHVLLASGRLPNVEELELDRVGLTVGRGGIPVDDRQRTNVDGVWAAGDVAAGPMLTPIAQYQARVAVEDMFGDGSRRVDYSALPTAIFTDPELGDVGLTEAEALEQGHDVGVVTASVVVGHPSAVHACETRPLQDRLRPEDATSARRARRLARGERHRREHHPCSEARLDRGRPRVHAPRLSELQRGVEGGC